MNRDDPLLQILASQAKAAQDRLQGARRETAPFGLRDRHPNGAVLYRPVAALATVGNDIERQSAARAQDAAVA